MINYKDNIDGISESQLKGFFVGWPNPPEPAKHLEMLRKSAYVWIAIDEEASSVVGFINAISDGVLASYIPLLEVLPEYQSKGIGSKLIEKMLNTLDQYYITDLVCDIDKVDYYKKLGFFSGNAMIIRNYDKQNGI